MRLLHTSDVRFDEFYGTDTPSYAIISHRWGEEEISFQDVRQIKGDWEAVRLNDKGITTMKGFEKLYRSVQLARQNHCEYIWIDTCCIDRASSSELTEAINSMYIWCEKAKACYVYLNDVRDVDELAASTWFTRGWTLQELIAPSNVEFYSSSWIKLGEKRQPQLFTKLLSIITKIPINILMGTKSPLEVSIATRMSWAATRQTTRVEDVAYCLMGLFEVNMPLLYGEGKKAFIRLQEHILERSDDETIFSWNATVDRGEPTLCGLLADHPSQFQEATSLDPMTRLSFGEPWSITNKGLRMQFKLHECHDVEGADYFVILNCQSTDNEGLSPVVYLKRMWIDEFARVLPHKTTFKSALLGSTNTTAETVFIKHKPSQRSQCIRIIAKDVIGTNSDRTSPLGWTVRDVYPRASWNDSVMTLQPGDFRFGQALAVFRIEIGKVSIVDVAVGLTPRSNREFRSWCVQLHAGNTNWRPEDHLWLVNNLLKDGKISNLDSSSSKDIFGIPMPSHVTIEEQHGVRSFDIVIDIDNLTRPSSVAREPVQVPVNLKQQAIEQEPAGLEVVLSKQQGGIVQRVPRFSKLTTEIWARPNKQIPSIPHPVAGVSMLSKLYVEGISPDESNWQGTNERGFSMHEIITSINLPPVLESPPELTPEYAYYYCLHGEIENAARLHARGLLDLKGPSDPWIRYPLLHWAVLGGNTRNVEVLRLWGCTLDTLAPGDYSVFHIAAAKGDAKMFNYLISELQHNMPEYAALSKPSRITGDAPLHMAAAFATKTSFWEDLTPQAWFWLIEDAQNPINTWGASPMHIAALVGNLVASYALLNVIDGEGDDLDPAYKQRLKAVASERANSVDSMGRTCFWYAVLSDSAEVIKLLAECGPGNIGLTDLNGVAPIHVACALGHVRSLRALIDGGADVDSATGELLLLPTHIAAIYGQIECLKVLCANSAALRWDPANRNTPAWDAICLAVVNRHERCAAVLWDLEPEVHSGLRRCVIAADKGRGRLSVEDVHVNINGTKFQVVVPVVAATATATPAAAAAGAKPSRFEELLDSAHVFTETHEKMSRRHILSRAFLAIRTGNNDDFKCKLRKRSPDRRSMDRPLLS